MTADLARKLQQLAWDQPSPLRRGKISPSGRYHYCTTCGRWGGFGYHCGTSKEEWYCDLHRPDRPNLLDRLRNSTSEIVQPPPALQSEGK